MNSLRMTAALCAAAALAAASAYGATSSERYADAKAAEARVQAVQAARELVVAATNGIPALIAASRERAFTDATNHVGRVDAAVLAAANAASTARTAADQAYTKATNALDRASAAASGLAGEATARAAGDAEATAKADSALLAAAAAQSKADAAKTNADLALEGLATKQNALVAGDNITINGTRISANVSDSYLPVVGGTLSGSLLFETYGTGIGSSEHGWLAYISDGKWKIPQLSSYADREEVLDIVSRLPPAPVDWPAVTNAAANVVTNVLNPSVLRPGHEIEVHGKIDATTLWVRHDDSKPAAERTTGIRFDVDGQSSSPEFRVDPETLTPRWGMPSTGVFEDFVLQTRLENSFNLLYGLIGELAEGAMGVEGEQSVSNDFSIVAGGRALLERPQWLDGWLVSVDDVNATTVEADSMVVGFLNFDTVTSIGQEDGRLVQLVLNGQEPESVPFAMQPEVDALSARVESDHQDTLYTMTSATAYTARTNSVQYIDLTGLGTLTISPPPAVQGRVRDWLVYVFAEADKTDALTFGDFASLLAADASATNKTLKAGVTMFAFSEIASGRFVVGRQELTDVTPAP